MNQQVVSQLPIIDNPHAPEVFATDALSFSLRDGNIAITFASMRTNNAAAGLPLSRVVIGTLVMPVRGARDLVTGLYDFMKQRGIDPVPPAPPKEQMQ